MEAARHQAEHGRQQLEGRAWFRAVSAQRLELLAVVRLEVGEIDPDHVHTPGIFVQRIVQVPSSNPTEQLS